MQESIVNYNNLTPSPGIVTAAVNQYLDAVSVQDVLVAQSNARMIGTKFISEVEVAYKDPRNPLPPKVAVFRTTIGPQGDVNLGEQLPTYEEEYNTFINPVGGFIILRYATYTAYPDKVVIKAGSINPFSETYLIYVLKDKSDRNRIAN